LSKNLFNLANYHAHQYFLKNSKKLSFNQLYHLGSKTSNYLALPTKVSKQIIRRDELPKYSEEKPFFKGKRVARGLDKMGTNQLSNADV
jgi:hypothetical protein